MQVTTCEGCGDVVRQRQKKRERRWEKELEKSASQTRSIAGIFSDQLVKK